MVEKKAMAKIVLLGEMGVGKTTLLNSFMGNQLNFTAIDDIQKYNLTEKLTVRIYKSKSFI